MQLDDVEALYEDIREYAVRVTAVVHSTAVVKIHSTAVVHSAAVVKIHSTAVVHSTAVFGEQGSVSASGSVPLVQHVQRQVLQV